MAFTHPGGAALDPHGHLAVMRTPRTRTRLLSCALACAAALVLVTPLAGQAAPGQVAPGRIARSAPRSADVEDIPVTFTVQNVNRSLVPCASDGKTYQVRGHIVGPASQVHQRRIKLATLYLHGLSFGEFFWRFQGDRGHDYATDQARRGNVSVVVDRIGYGASDKPDGNQVCVGSRADMAHQMVQALRQGHYRADSGRVPRASRVVLAGHSYGGQIAQVEAYSFGGVAGVFLLGYSDRVQSDLLRQSAAYARQVCASGGLPVGTVSGYAPFGPPPGAPVALFNSAKPKIEAAAAQLLTLDPCGDTASFDAATAVDLQQVQRIRVPVLVVAGGADKLFPPPAASDQAGLLSGSRSVTQRTLPGTAHAYTFERTENKLVQVVDRWLTRRIR